jgi:prophage regulatory protein
MKNKDRREPPKGYLRIAQICGDRRAKPPVPGIIPVGRSTWWKGVREGRFPPPIRVEGLRCTFWDRDAVLALGISAMQKRD